MGTTDGPPKLSLANLKPFAPGTNSQTGEVNRRGPDRLPRTVKFLSRLAMTSLIMNDQKALRQLLQRLQRMPNVKSDFAFIRYLEFLKSLLEPPEKNGHAAERPPLAQIIVNGKPVMPAPESEPEPPGPDYEENGQGFTQSTPRRSARTARADGLQPLCQAELGLRPHGDTFAEDLTTVVEPHSPDLLLPWGCGGRAAVSGSAGKSLERGVSGGARSVGR